MRRASTRPRARRLKTRAARALIDACCRSNRTKIGECPDCERRLMRIKALATMRHPRRDNGGGGGIEALERRVLLADTTVSIKVKKADASETDPAGAGLGQMTVLRSGGATTGALNVAVRFSPGASSAMSGVDFEPIVKTVRI